MCLKKCVTNRDAHFKWKDVYPSLDDDYMMFVFSPMHLKANLEWSTKSTWWDVGPLAYLILVHSCLKHFGILKVKSKTFIPVKGAQSLKWLISKIRPLDVWFKPIKVGMSKRMSIPQYKMPISLCFQGQNIIFEAQQIDSLNQWLLEAFQPSKIIN